VVPSASVSSLVIRILKGLAKCSGEGMEGYIKYFRAFAGMKKCIAVVYSVTIWLQKKFAKPNNIRGNTMLPGFRKIC
jgi:hypothetical protein